MKKNEKEAVIKLLGGLGFLAIIIGLFTNLYAFLVGVVVGIAIWIVTGVVAKYFGVGKK